MDDETIERNLAQQVEVYGESAAALVGRIRDRLGLTQRRIASVLGLSPAMLSQLVTGQRIKIGNPAVVGRLTALIELADGDTVPSGSDLERRLEQIQAETRKLSTVSATRPGDAEPLPAQLRRVATRDELRSASRLLATDHAVLAELLRQAADG